MAHTKQKTLQPGETWVLPMNTSARDFEATVVAYKEQTAVTLSVQATISAFTDIEDDEGNGAIWFDFFDADKMSAFVAAAGPATLVQNIGKPVVALKFSASGGNPLTFQVLQSCF